jgi:Galactoside-binding lectin
MNSSKFLVYSSKLLPVEVGHVVIVTGRTKEAAESFDVFLGADEGLGDDFGSIQFHAAVKFTDEPVIVRNSYVKGTGWEKEETEENLLPNCQPNPIKRGGDFKIAIYADTNMFVVSIDEKPFCTFPYRQDLPEVQRFNIHGDVEEVYEVVHSNVQAPKTRSGNFALSIPVMDVEMATVIKGTPRGNEAGEFEITLVGIATGKVLLELKANFGEKKVVGNTKNESSG